MIRKPSLIVVIGNPCYELSLRLEPQVINKLKELADKEGLRPTTYARMLIIRAIRNKAA